MWLVSLLLLLACFYLQNLLPLVWRRYFDPFVLPVIFLSYRGRGLSAIGLAVGFGLLLDAYNHAPLGLEASRLLLVVLGVRLLQRWLNLKYVLPQILAVALLLLAQGLLTLGWLKLLLPVDVDPAPVWALTWRTALGTSLVAPVGFSLLLWLENRWGRRVSARS